MTTIFIIEDDEIMQDCLASAILLSAQQSSDKNRGGNQNRGLEICRFTNAVDAMTAIDETPPNLIFLDILLDGPDGFTLLHELTSYSDLSRIPVVLVTSLSLAANDLSNYGVVGILDKTKMTPREIGDYVRRYL